jgi:hypothetical protein
MALELIAQIALRQTLIGEEVVQRMIEQFRSQPEDETQEPLIQGCAEQAEQGENEDQANAYFEDRGSK